MSDKLSGPREGHPVLSGLAALVGVGLVVGLVVGGVAWAGSQALGLGGNVQQTTTTPGTGESLYLPKPSKTEQPSDPLITLAAAPGQPQSQPQKKQGEKKGGKSKETKAPPISLSVTQTSVSAMQRIDVTGVYPTGEGRILQFQRLVSGSWTDFPVTVPVSNQTFATYLLTGQAGVNKFRVTDTDNGRFSNVVTVTVR